MLIRSLLMCMVLLAAAACGDDDDVGKPCEKDEDCAGDLVCDVHDGRGSCQEPHDH
jgi:hypothetical protein